MRNQTMPVAPAGQPLQGLATEDRQLPPDAELRANLHNEVHARPAARIRLPALVVYVAVLNDGVSRADELAHLQCLPNQQHLTLADLSGNFLRLRCANHTVKWERHSEFTRYSIVQPLPDHATLGNAEPELLSALRIPAEWLRDIPGQTMAAIKLVMLHGDPTDPAHTLDQARTWLGDHMLVASVMGNNGHSWAVTDFLLRPNGFERILVIAPPGTTETRAGRVSQRLLELETYRLMALRGLPVAKSLGSMLSATEQELADITAQIEQGTESDPELLHHLATLAARVEQATAHHAYRFSATQAYHSIVPLEPSAAGQEPQVYDVVGPICESGDWLGRERSLAVAAGDLLAVLSTGAYCSSMGSTYNTRPRPAELLVDGAAAHLIRVRESVSDIYRCERLIPAKA